MGLISGITALIGRTKTFGHSESFNGVRELVIEAQDEAPWSIRRMLVISAAVSMALWAPIVYVAVKAFTG